MVYIAKKNGNAVHHTSLEAMKQIDGIDTPEMKVSDEEFAAAECLVRVIGEKIVLGKTKAERDAETSEKRKTEIENQLIAIDVKSSRAARAIALAVSSKKTPAEADVQRLEELEAEATQLRIELKTLTA